MTVRKFNHMFSTPVLTNTGTVDLSTSDIAAAAMMEISQLSLSIAPFDLFVEELLDPTSGYFVFRRQLGQIRETRTALSGLFGRFVARAYLTTQHEFTHFWPIRTATHALSGLSSVVVIKSPVANGDMPDWVANFGSSRWAFAEAKGSYNARGASVALGAAKEQVKNAQLHVSGSHIKTEHFSVSTRWAVENIPALQIPEIACHDPPDGGEPASEEETKRIRREIRLGHYASLAKGWGCQRTARLLRFSAYQSGTPRYYEPRELVTIDDADGIAVGLAVLATNSGLIRLPATGVEGFVDAVNIAHRGKVLLLFVDKGNLSDIDEPFLAEKGERRLEPTKSLTEWPAEFPGGLRTFPAAKVRVRRNLDLQR